MLALFVCVFFCADIILFQPLSPSNLASIVHIQLGDLVRRLAEREMTLSLTPAATDFILSASYVPAFGARPLRRFIEKHVTTAISKLLIEGRLRKRSTVVIGVTPDGAELSFDVVAAPARGTASANSSANNSPVFQPFKKARGTATGGRGKEDVEYMNED